MGDAISHPKEKLRERSSTYFLQDWSKQKEMARLKIQDKMLTLGMGEVLPESVDPTLLRRVLDVGCGTGGWLIETAKRYPAIEKLVGADISNTMVAHARQEATAALLDGRVQFQAMDALGTLDFPASSFDLVNQRMGTSWVRTWEWKKLLAEYQRVSCPGGIIRITEPRVGVESNSPALNKLDKIFLETFYHSGRIFTASNDGLICELARLMAQHGIENIQTQVRTLVFEAGTEGGRNFYEDTRHLYRVCLPFFHRWTRVPDDYEQIYQQALKEMQEPGFVATWPLLTVWGTSSRGGRSSGRLR
jgi:ubiquinone/menaquinone biosynthesis C-methylase UbiE